MATNVHYKKSRTRVDAAYDKKQLKFFYFNLSFIFDLILSQVTFAAIFTKSLRILLFIS